ncbi:MAG: DUF4143 domain-containing protein [Oligoflexia bacterium]|nr:DUF4143 domain-containing protein [Oligoflexia bacterium]
MDVHRSILQTYRDDFTKYKTRIGINKIGELFEKIPNGLGKKVKYSQFFPEEKSTTVSKLIDLFIKARLILPAYHTNGTKPPISAQKDESTFKLFFLDIGLFNRFHNLSYEDLNSSNSKFLTEGFAAEQFVAQHLAYALSDRDRLQLFYWLKDKKTDMAELDFIISKGKTIIPLEVKSSKTGTLKSLFYFMGINKYKLAVRLDCKERNAKEIEEKVSFSIANQQEKIKCNFKLINIPLYMIEKIYDII